MALLGLGWCIVACNGTSEHDDPRGAPRVALHEVATEPASEMQAIAERDKLLRDVRLHLAAITGQPTGSTHPTLVTLEQNAQDIRDSLQVLYVERDLHGLGWRNSIDRLIHALERQYAVLEQIREHLQELEIRRSPNGSGE